MRRFASRPAWRSPPVVAGGSALAKNAKPKFGDYRGKAKSTVRDNADSPPVYFISKKGKGGKSPRITSFDGSVPIDCNGDGFDLPLGTTVKLPISIKASGKLSITENAISLTDLVNAGKLGSAPNAIVKATFSGKITRQQGQGELRGQLLGRQQMHRQGDLDGEALPVGRGASP